MKYNTDYLSACSILLLFISPVPDGTGKIRIFVYSVFSDRRSTNKTVKRFNVPQTGRKNPHFRIVCSLTVKAPTKL